MDPMQFFEDPQMAIFAAELLRNPEDPLACAKHPDLFPLDLPRALWISQNWPRDPRVIKYMEAMRQNYGAGSFELPTPEQYARFLWKCAKDEDDPDLKLKFARLFGEAQGYLKKNAGDNTGTVINNVMVVKDQGDDEKWEERTARQQNELQADLRDIADAQIEDVDESGTG